MLVDTLDKWSGSFKYRELKPSDDIEHYLLAFERATTTTKVSRDAWAVKLELFLTGKALAAYANRTLDEVGNHDSLKGTTLKRYNISQEAYRKRFRACQKKLMSVSGEHAEAPRFVFQIGAAQGENSRRYSDMIMLVQPSDEMPRELQIQLRKRKLRRAKEAQEMTDDYLAAKSPKLWSPYCLRKANFRVKIHLFRRERPKGFGE